MLKHIIREQYQYKINQLLDIKAIIRPKEGWIRTMRKALGMSSVQLAKRLDVSRSQASQMERMEVEDRITLKQLRRVAENLGCDLFYGFKPRKAVGEMIRDRARQKARSIVEQIDVHMKLEAQQLSKEKLNTQIELEVERLVREMPRDLWED